MSFTLGRNWCVTTESPHAVIWPEQNCLDAYEICKT